MATIWHHQFNREAFIMVSSSFPFKGLWPALLRSPLSAPQPTSGTATGAARSSSGEPPGARSAPFKTRTLPIHLPGRYFLYDLKESGRGAVKQQLTTSSLNSGREQTCSSVPEKQGGSHIVHPAAAGPRATAFSGFICAQWIFRRVWPFVLEALHVLKASGKRPWLWLSGDDSIQAPGTVTFQHSIQPVVPVRKPHRF